MDRREAQQLSDAITRAAGYKVEQSASEGILVVEDRITHLRYPIKSPADWLSVQDRCKRARIKMARTNKLPDPEPPAPDAPIAREVRTPVPQPPAPLAPNPVELFDVSHWTTITSQVIAAAEQKVDRLRKERGTLNERIHETKRAVKARRAEIDQAISSQLNVIKGLRRSLNIVKSQTARADGARTGLTVPKWGPIALVYAREHDGEIPTLELAKAHGVFPSRFTSALRGMVRHGKLVKVSKYRYRLLPE